RSIYVLGLPFYVLGFPFNALDRWVHVLSDPVFVLGLRHFALRGAVGTLSGKNCDLHAVVFSGD
ncbi:MAG TPA: hypothetical protein VFG14_19290, partial [Chthoniobacteraceae bacterium]|nr:hypothetical protein [Chthoniobacteraceae bacterium]